MKLTKLMKEAFVRAVLQDVPKVDNRDKIQKILNEAVRKSAHKEINDLHQKYPGLFETGVTWVEPNQSELRDKDYEVRRGERFDLPPHQSLTGTGYRLEELKGKKILTEEQLKELTELLTQERKSLAVALDLKEKLESVIAGCNTLKQLKEALPEFEKYMPSKEEASSKNLPALANLVTDFVAAGWPKDKVQ